MNDPHVDVSELIEAGRTERLDDAQRARVEKRWRAFLATTAVTSATAAASPAVAAGKLTFGLGAKVALGVLALGGIGATVAITRPARQAMAPSAPPIVASAAPVVATPEPTSAPVGTPAPPSTSSIATVSPHGPRAPRSKESGPSTLSEEVQVMREVQGALRSGHPDRALALLDEAKKRPIGQNFAEERGAARVVALCALGRVDEAKESARQFQQTWPSSALTERVRTTCVTGAGRRPDDTR